MKNIIRILVALFLAAMIFAYLHSQKSRGDEPRRLRISCVNNLKQIELSFSIWSGDHGYQYPWNVSTNAGGTKELCEPDKDGFDLNSFRHFQVMSNEVSSPLVLICSSEKRRKPAANLSGLTASNVSYRIHIVPGLAPGSTNQIPLIVCPVDGSILYYDGSIKAGNPNEPNDEPAK